MLSPPQAERRAGIVTFRLANEAPADTRARLQAGRGVCAERGGGVRFSPHFYTDYSVMERAMALL